MPVAGKIIGGSAGRRCRRSGYKTGWAITAGIVERDARRIQPYAQPLANAHILPTQPLSKCARLNTKAATRAAMIARRGFAWLPDTARNTAARA
jgi:hypothetical protein